MLVRTFVRNFIASVLAAFPLLATSVGTGAVLRGTTGPSSYALEIEGQRCGFVSDFEGGSAVADVVTEKMGPDRLQRKHIGNVKYEDISFNAGTGMCAGLYDWIDAGFGRRGVSRKKGAIVQLDAQYREISRLTFTNALITEVGMPALDASSKDAAKMTIKFKPESTRRVVSARPKMYASPPRAAVQKRWLPANFRLRIDGHDVACSRVNKIEALVIKQKVTESAVGELRDYEKVPGSVEVPNLVITLPESHGKSFYDWHEDFVIKGNSGQDKEKGGSLEYLTPDLKTVLFTLTFKNLGIFKLMPDKAKAGDAVRRVKAEMYTENITFKFAKIK